MEEADRSEEHLAACLALPSVARPAQHGVEFGRTLRPISSVSMPFNALEMSERKDDPLSPTMVPLWSS